MDTFHRCRQHLARNQEPIHGIPGGTESDTESQTIRPCQLPTIVESYDQRTGRTVFVAQGSRSRSLPLRRNHERSVQHEAEFVLVQNPAFVDIVVGRVETAVAVG